MAYLLYLLSSLRGLDEGAAFYLYSYYLHYAATYLLRAEETKGWGTQNECS